MYDNCLVEKNWLNGTQGNITYVTGVFQAALFISLQVKHNFRYHLYTIFHLDLSFSHLNKLYMSGDSFSASRWHDLGGGIFPLFREMSSWLLSLHSRSFHTTSGKSVASTLENCHILLPERTWNKRLHYRHKTGLQKKKHIQNFCKSQRAEQKQNKPTEGKHKYRNAGCTVNWGEYIFLQIPVIRHSLTTSENYSWQID